MRNHIPAYHLGFTADQKLTNEWWQEAIQHCYYHSNNVNLLQGKNVKEIDSYADGTYSMKGYKKLFKRKDNKEYTDVIATNNEEEDASDSGIGYERLPLLPPKLRAAQSVIERTPVEVTAEAMDALAWEKKEKDVQFLKHKPEFERDLQEISDQMGLGKVDLGSTKYTAIPFSSSPYGLDLNEADELQVFIDILAGLSVEAAYETILQSYWQFRNLDGVKSLWVKDQFRYAVSCHRGFPSAMTGLGDMEYVYPGNVSCPKSDYHDFRDVPQMIHTETISVIDLFNKLGHEIGSKEKLYDIIGQYVTENNLVTERKDYDTLKVSLEYIEVKSIDWIGVVPVNKKSKYIKLTKDEDEVKEYKGTKKWRQNTYYAYWLRGTDTFFGKGKLDFAYRAEGKENFQGFSIFAYKSEEKSAVELSIPENKKAQIADIKMQHAVMKAKKSGMYIDLAFLRNTLTGLKEYPQYTLPVLLEMALKENDIIGDTSGFDQGNQGNFKPFERVEGGIGRDLLGYAQVIMDASQKIGTFTGINDQLTGQAANPEGLVGMQRLLINSSVNSISYINTAIASHCSSFFNLQAVYIKDSIQKGGKQKEAIQRLIGSKKVTLLSDLDDIPLHQMGINVMVTQREEEKEEYRQEIVRLKNLGVVNTVDDYILSAVRNPKDKMALLAVRTKQFERKLMQQRSEANEQQQVLLMQAGQNQQAAVQAKTEGEKEKIYAQGDVSANVLKLAAQLGMNETQMKAMNDKMLQQERNNAQLNKNIQTMREEQSLENQKPFE